MERNVYEKIEAYEGLLEELNLQRLELTVARDLALQVQARMTQRLVETSRSRRRLYYRQHLDFLIEGLAVLERGINAVSNNIDHYDTKFSEYLAEVTP